MCDERIEFMCVSPGKESLWERNGMSVGQNIVCL